MKEFLTAVLLCGAALGADGGVRPLDGGLWPDDKGVHVNAHGGGVLFAEGRYWWYGEHKVAGRAGNKAMVGVHAYSSANLTDWKDEGIVLPVSDDPTSDIVKGCVIERPKVLRSRKTGRYAMYFHLELKGQRYDAARTGLAVADRPNGPFTFLRSFRPTAGAWPLNAKPEDRTPETRRAACELGAESTLGPGAGGPLDKVRSRVPYVAHVEGGQMSRDMTLFMDDDGTAYHVFASEYNSTLHVAELTDDLLGYTGRWSRITEMEWTEAPALFKRGGWYYLVGSGCTGWKPNTARSYRARNVFGPWERLDNPCTGTNPSNGLGPELTWGGQSTCVFKIEGTDDFVAMFDIWRPEDAIDGRYVWKRISFTDDGRVRIPFGGAPVRVPTGEVRPAAASPTTPSCGGRRTRRSSVGRRRARPCASRSPTSRRTPSPGRTARGSCASTCGTSGRDPSRSRSTTDSSATSSWARSGSRRASRTCSRRRVARATRRRCAR